MILSEWIKKNKGDTAKIGTKGGSGFIFAGKVDSFTLNHIEAYTGVKMHGRDVLETYPSAFGGTVVLIRGKEHGNKDTPVPPITGEVPDGNYHALIGMIAKSAAEEYEHALMVKVFSNNRKHENVEYQIKECRQFFLSDSFALLMPHVNGEEVLHLIEQKVYKAVRDFGEDHDRD